MSAPRKFDAETRAVRLYTDRLRDHGDSKLAARKHVGELLDINPATLRNWVEHDQKSAKPVSAGDDANDRPGRVSTVAARERRAAPGERDPEDGVGVFRPGRARPSTPVKLRYIHAYRERFGVEPICVVLTEHDMTIAPGTYYPRLARPVPPAELDDASLVGEIVDLYRKNWCVYGVGEDVACRPADGPGAGSRAEWGG